MSRLQSLDISVIYQYLSAINAIATINFTTQSSDAEKICLEQIYNKIFKKDDFDANRLTEVRADHIKKLLPDYYVREQLAQMQCVMALINAELNEAKLKIVLDYMQTLEINEPYTKHLKMLYEGKIGQLIEDMTIKNYQSIFGGLLSYKEIQHAFFPYTGSDDDKKLADKFYNLEMLPADSLGYQFWHWYTSRKFKFPGEPGGFYDAFAVPHDCTHIIAGYDTDAEGEICVSTFTAHMNKKLPMTGHILPVILTWHLGIDVNELVRVNIGKLNIPLFWDAWVRGYQINTNIFSKQWDFWTLKNESVDALRKTYGL